MNLDAKRDIHVQKCILALARQLWPEVAKCIEWRMKHPEQLTEDSTREELTFGDSQMGISIEDYSEEITTESGIDCDEIPNEESERELKVPEEELKEDCAKYVLQEEYNEIFAEEEEEEASKEICEEGTIYHETVELEGKGIGVIEDHFNEDEDHTKKEQMDYIEEAEAEGVISNEKDEKFFNENKCGKLQETCFEEVFAYVRECDEVKSEEEPEDECVEYKEDYAANSHVEVEVTVYVEGADGEDLQSEDQVEPVEASGELEGHADSINKLGDEHTNNVEENVEGLIKEKYDCKIVKTEEECKRQDEEDKFLKMSANDEVLVGANVHDECDYENQEPKEIQDSENALPEEEYVDNEEKEDGNRLYKEDEINEQAPELYAQNNDVKLEYTNFSMHTFTENDEIFPSEAESHCRKEQPECQFEGESGRQPNAGVCPQIPASDIERLLMLAREVCPEFSKRLDSNLVRIALPSDYLDVLWSVKASFQARCPFTRSAVTIRFPV
nr:expressed protein [Hymenolepis microstoma]